MPQVFEGKVVKRLTGNGRPDDKAEADGDAKVDRNAGVSSDNNPPSGRQNRHAIGAQTRSPGESSGATLATSTPAFALTRTNDSSLRSRGAKRVARA